MSDDKKKYQIISPRGTLEGGYPSACARIYKHRPTTVMAIPT